MARLMRLFYKLTRRELEIVAVMNSYPHCNANMLSELLCVTRSCVYGHCSRIYAKLRVTNKLEMLLWCRENELVSGLEEFVPDCARRRAEELGIVSRSL